MAQPDQCCRRCCNPVGSHPWLHACGHVYHEKCFMCESCAKIINPGESAEYNNNPYHKDCIEKIRQEKESRRCHACGKGMDKKGVVCHDYFYHKQCFKCDECYEVIPIDLWFDKKDKVYCKKCFEKQYPTKCNNCNKLIIGNIVVTTHGNIFCSTCLVCKSCRRLVKGNKYFEEGSHLYCIDCETQYRNARYVSNRTAVGVQGPMFAGLMSAAKPAPPVKPAAEPPTPEEPEPPQNADAQPKSAVSQLAQSVQSS